MTNAPQSPLGETGRFERALAAIDAANAEDPVTLETPSGPRPKELVHAEMATAWVRELVAEPSEALLLAARAHHLRRWQLPRSAYPDGRAGYKRWRRELQKRHARDAGEILRQVGYGEETIERVGEILRKRRLGRDPEVQALEDALCLVFVETQLHELAARYPLEKMIEIVARTLRKMSPAGRAAAAALDLPDGSRQILARAAEVR